MPSRGSRVPPGCGLEVDERCRGKSRPFKKPRDDSGGFTLFELLIALAVIGILAAISINVYASALDKARVVKAIADIRNIEKSISSLEMEGELPGSLEEIGWGSARDPWGNPYQYLNFANAKGKSKLRKDRFLVPLNSTYDLYSMGQDGQSKAPLTARVSRDDIVRAGDGAFVGLASDF